MERTQRAMPCVGRMTNDCAQMPKGTRNPNDKRLSRPWSVVILSSLVLSHSSFRAAGSAVDSAPTPATLPLPTHSPIHTTHRWFPPLFGIQCAKFASSRKLGVEEAVMHTPIVKLQAIRNSCTLDKGDVTCLRDVSLAINAGEFIALSGASGSGKNNTFESHGWIQPIVPT